MESIPWGHIVAEGAVTLLAVAGGGLLLFNKLTVLMREYRLHSHTEDDGTEGSRDETLAVKGIRYPRTLNGK
jgi:uncharacterized iron-regulated membrane protein